MFKKFTTSELAKLCKDYPFGSQDDKKNPLAIAKLIARSERTVVYYVIEYDSKEKVAKVYACGYEGFEENGKGYIDADEFSETHSCNCCKTQISTFLDSSFKPKPLSECLEEKDEETQAFSKRQQSEKRWF